MSHKENPWSSRFCSRLSDAEIIQLARVELPPLVDLHSLSVEQACRKLSLHFEKTYVPTEQSVGVLRQLLHVAHAHCQMTYASDLEFSQNVHEQSTPLPNIYLPFCLTGLPGVGKSVLMDAFRRVLPKDSEIWNSACCTEFPLVASWSIKINANASPVAMLANLSGLSHSAIGDLLNRARYLAYRDGVSFAIADEFQFANQSTAANANVTKLLLYLGYLGIPNVFVANFSLLRKLLKRPKEDRDRLLSRVLILKPVSKGSKDWIEIVRAYKSAVPDVFIFNEHRCADELHNLTAGIGRILAGLLVLAYRNGRNRASKVDLNAIFDAYRSGEFSLLRRDVEAIQRQVISKKPSTVADDLWCPIEGGNVLGVEDQGCIPETQSMLVKSSLTRSEQIAVGAINKRLKNSSSSGKVISIKSSQGSHAEKLLDDTAWLMDEL